jgi:MFS family permease
LKIKQSGFADSTVIGIYIFYNLVYALFAFKIGSIADKIGLKKMLVFGLIVFATVYLGMSYFASFNAFIILFFLYGIYAASTEGISKAWISNIADKKDTATAIGSYAGFQTICTMLASTMTGLLWFYMGAGTAFLITGAVCIFIACYFLFWVVD